MQENPIIVYTAPWNTSFPPEQQARRTLQEHGCLFEFDEGTQKTQITFPAGTTWEWDLRVGPVERFILTLPSGLRILEVRNARFEESALGFLPPLEKNPL